MRSGGGITPVYVGKTKRSFLEECFGLHQLDKYNRCLSQSARGTPVLFLLAYPLKRGRASSEVIDELEDWLIQVAWSRNSSLLNVQGIKTQRWGVRSVVRSPTGGMSADAAIFKKMMWLD